MDGADVDLDTVWKPPPGSLSGWYRCLIAGTTIATILLAYLAWHVIWTVYGCSYHFYGFWVRHGVWLGIAVCSLAAFAPASRVSRFVRLATLMPVIHLAAVVASVVLWHYLRVHAEGWPGYDVAVDPTNSMIAMPMHAWEAALAATFVLVSTALIIQPREWLQTMLVLALSFLLLFGAWLPFSVCGAVHGERTLSLLLEAPNAMLERALMPPLLAALAFTTLLMRWPRVARKSRGWIVMLTAALLLIAAFSQLSPAKPDTVLYVDTLQLVLLAQGLAIAALILAGVMMYVRTSRARSCVRGMATQLGTITDPDRDREPVVQVEFASWLRAPRILIAPFEVDTPTGAVLATGTRVLWNVPAATTCLAAGEQCPVLRRGDVVGVYRRDVAADGHPFRSMQHVQHLVIAAPGAIGGFTNMTLMLWRPAVAYMAIALAVMIPAALALHSLDIGIMIYGP